MDEEGRVSFQELGARVRDVRLQKGVSLSEVSLHTRVREHILSAIEEGRMEDLPAAVYVRGFVRSYLSFLDAEDLWPAFENAVPLTGFQNSSRALGTYSAATKGFRRVTRRGAYILLVLLVAVVVAFAWSQWDTIRLSIAERTAPSTVVVATDAPEEAPEIVPVDGGGTTENSSPDVSPVEVARVLSEMLPSSDLSQEPFAGIVPLSEGLSSASEHPAVSESSDFPWLQEMAQTTPQPREEQTGILRLDSAGACWVQVRQGERILYTGTMQKGDSREFSVSEETSVRFGNPAAVTITWQEKSLPASDGTGKPRTIHFTSRGEMR